MAEPGNKLFQKVPSSRQEESSLETVVFPESNIAFFDHFVSIEIPNLVRESPTGGIFLDFGCGNGSMLSIICDSLRNHGLNKRLQIMGYDPNLPKIDEDSRVGRKKKIYEISYTDSLPERADIIVANFSLHHADSIKEELEKVANLGATFVTIAEYDFSKLRALPEDQAVEEFKRGFQASEAGLTDYEDFRRQAMRSGRSVDEAWRDCYLFHQKYSKEDFSQALESAGYSPMRIVLPSGRQDKYKFILTAKKK